MGRGGQGYQETSSRKILKLSRMFPAVPLWVDGGINGDNFRAIEGIGGKVAVVGSYITNNQKPEETLDYLKGLSDI